MAGVGRVASRQATIAAMPASAQQRRSPGWKPKQHGAWFMLALPLVVGLMPFALLTVLSARLLRAPRTTAIEPHD